MEHIKNKKTQVLFGASVPAAGSKNLAAAEAIATVGFGCSVTSMNGIELTRGTTDDPAVYCQSDEDFKKKDTGDLEVSPWSMEGMVGAGADAADYIAAKALADQMIKADTRGTLVIIEPNGTDKMWFEIKWTKVAKLRGAADEKQKFNLEAIPMTMPTDA